MRFSHPSPQESVRPRPARGAEVASGFKDEEDDGIEFDPKKDILKKDWDGMKEILEGFRRDTDWWDFSEMAMCLCVLAAQRAQLTHDGRILLTHKPPKLSREPKPLPVRSNIT